MPYEPRFYRAQMNRAGLTYFPVLHRETDLWIGVDVGSVSPALPQTILHRVRRLRRQLDDYIAEQPAFLRSLLPVLPLPGAPALAQLMCSAARAGGVGPMAAVAGAFAEMVGQWLIREVQVRECVIENGGDIFLHTLEAARIGIYAGASPLSGKLALRVPAAAMPLGVCTSAGTVGPSLSLGRTDATVTLCASAALADAYATTLGNLVKSPADIDRALAIAQRLPDLIGCVLIAGDKLGAWGDVELEPLCAPAQSKE